MKIKRLIAIICMFSLSIALLTGCGRKVTSPLDGKWAYIYDTETVGLKIDGDTAKLDGKKYDFSMDDIAIYLKDSKGFTQGLRYRLEGENGMYLYKEASYKYQGEGSPDGLLGQWIDTSNGNSSFEFTVEGTFREDSYIPGYYTVDEESNSILLVYNDHYEDTVIYYTIKDDILLVEYPWPMVKIN